MIVESGMSHLSTITVRKSARPATFPRETVAWPNLKKQIWSESLMAFIRCNIFPDGKRGKRTQLAGI